MRGAIITSYVKKGAASYKRPFKVMKVTAGFYHLFPIITFGISLILFFVHIRVCAGDKALLTVALHEPWANAAMM